MHRFILFLTCFCTFQLNAQFNSSKNFYPSDSIIVELSSSIGKVYHHQMKSKETVYSLAKTFGQKTVDLAEANPSLDLNQISVGQKVSVPFLSTNLVKQRSALNQQNLNIPVFYKVQAKDNLYRIGKVYFNQTVENLLDINNMNNFDLKIGQLVQVGWMSISNNNNVEPTIKETSISVVKPETVIETPTLLNGQPEVADVEVSPVPEEENNSKNRKSSNRVKKEKKFLSKIKKGLGIKSKKKDIKEVVQLSEQLEKTEKFQEPEERKLILKERENNSPLKPDLKDIDNLEREVNEELTPEDIVDIVDNVAAIESAPPVIYKEEKGVAIWNMTSSNSKNLFALHPTAKVGSFIEITNPMMNKSVQAKVIGNIPPRTYTDDVSIVVSPRVAKMLGVVDKRFKVKMKFQE